MGRVSQALMPRKQRLLALLSGVEQLETTVLHRQPVTVLMVARCGHPECGCQPPAADELGSDALVIEMGCALAVPDVKPPDVEGARSRAERITLSDRVGQGLPEQRQRQLLKTIRLL